MLKRLLCLGAVLLALGTGLLAWWWPPFVWAFVVVGPLLLLAAHDLLQQRHTILRNYPVFGHLRYMLEDMRHQIRQYFIESDDHGNPISHGQRELVYRRAKDVSDVLPFGTLKDVYAPGYEWINHSMYPRQPAEHESRVRIGGPDCSQPYEASHLNVSAMSFGALSSHAIEALNLGARHGGFAHNTGEGGISDHHLKPGGDLIWEIGTGYFGCRTSDGRFAPELFAERAALPAVKMIELKLSQGAKPGGGGILPASKLTPAIARARGVPLGRDVHSPPGHTAFVGPRGLLEFLARLRELSGGKPVGFKLCVGRPEEFLAVCRAMHETGISPDYIVVDGKEGGTGAAPQEFSDHLGTPLREGLMFVHNALVGAGLRERVRIGAAGKLLSGFDMAAVCALGADFCYSARGMMFALGCIQARRCHTNRCPTGVATQDPWRVSGLVVADKAVRVHNFHRNTVKHFLKVLAAAGLETSAELHPGLLLRRVALGQVHSYRELYRWLTPGSLLDGTAPGDWRRVWEGGEPAAVASLISARNV